MFDISDTPIESKAQDLYGIDAFSQSLFEVIENIHNPNGEVIGLTGKWGTGKSSCINLIKEINRDKNVFIVNEFKCLWYQGEDTLAFNFLQNMIALMKGEGEEFIKDLKDFSRMALKGIGLASSFTPFSGNATFHNFIRDFELYLSEDKTIEELFLELKGKLSESKKHYLVIVDDLDRMSSKEIVSFLKILHFLGKLPRVTYLVAYDEDIVEKAIERESEGVDNYFLDKIIQFSYPLPVYHHDKLYASFYEEIKKIIKNETINQGYLDAVMELVIKPLPLTPRVKRKLLSSISISIIKMSGNVNAVDIIGLDAIRLLKPNVFKAIVADRYKLHNGLQTSFQEEIINKCSYDVGDGEYLTNVLDLLFPCDINEDEKNELLRNRNVRIPIVFESYLYFSLMSGCPSRESIEDLLKNIDSLDEIHAYLRGSNEEYSLEPMKYLLANIDRVDRSCMAGIVKEMIEFTQEYFHKSYKTGEFEILSRLKSDLDFAVGVTLEFLRRTNSSEIYDLLNIACRKFDIYLMSLLVSNKLGCSLIPGLENDDIDSLNGVIKGRIRKLIKNGNIDETLYAFDAVECLSCSDREFEQEVIDFFNKNILDKEGIYKTSLLLTEVSLIPKKEYLGYVEYIDLNKKIFFNKEIFVKEIENLINDRTLNDIDKRKFIRIKSKIENALKLKTTLF